MTGTWRTTRSRCGRSWSAAGSRWCRWRTASMNSAVTWRWPHGELMALVDAAALKRVLKVEHTAEDTLIGELLARVLGLVQIYIGCPITAAERTMIDPAETAVYGAGGPKTLIVPKTPFDPETIEITDRDGNDCDPDDM